LWYNSSLIGHLRISI